MNQNQMLNLIPLNLQPQGTEQEEVGLGTPRGMRTPNNQDNTSNFNELPGPGTPRDPASTPRGGLSKDRALSPPDSQKDSRTPSKDINVNDNITRRRTSPRLSIMNNLSPKGKLKTKPLSNALNPEFSVTSQKARFLLSPRSHTTPTPPIPMGVNG